MTLEDIRHEYDRLDALCGVDTSSVELVSSTRMKTRLGYCQYRNRKPAKIVIAAFMFEMSDEELLDTARHEYAHALVKIRRPRENHGHDAVWKAAAAEVGCVPRRTCQDAAINEYCKAKRRESSAKYRVKCVSCGKTWEYKRKGRIVAAILDHPRTRRFSCPSCHSRHFAVETLELRGKEEKTDLEVMECHQEKV